MLLGMVSPEASAVSQAATTGSAASRRLARTVSEIVRSLGLALSALLESRARGSACASGLPPNVHLRSNCIAIGVKGRGRGLSDALLACWVPDLYPQPCINFGRTGSPP